MTGDLSFFRGKRVLVTGHTGFKGAWLSRMLLRAGAQVTGYALSPQTQPNLFELCELETQMRSVVADVRDYERLQRIFGEARPQIVFHLAAQPLVLEGMRNPRATFETNVMGTVNLLDCVRTAQEPPISLVNVTTDKVYRNDEGRNGFCEEDVLFGDDPYSNSKSCSELVTGSYRHTYFSNRAVAISTVRAGNVIGGGDFAQNRILPDCVRAALANAPILVRNPHSVRPYQHVLEPLNAYLLIAQKQYEDLRYAACYNVGPAERDCVTTGELAQIFCDQWGEGLSWIAHGDGGPREAECLRLDCSKAKAVLGWSPLWNVETAVKKTVEWTKEYRCGGAIQDEMDRQIADYLSGKDG